MTLTIEEGIVELERALDALGSHLPDAGAEASAAAGRIRERVQVGGDKTVVVLAGATGSGKSSLFNSLVGQDVAQVAPIRPTTTEALAVSETPAAPVLDWMDVNIRKIIPQALGDEDIVLVDLPDLDSTEREHRRLADAVIERADVVVFVLDPQKYADAVIHKDYLEAFVERGAVCLVVLNQIDRVPADEREGLIDDVRGLLARDGLDSTVIFASARTGEGIDEVREALLEFAQQRQAVRLRIAADLRSAGARLAYAARSEGGTSARSQSQPDFSGVARAVAQVAGSHEVARAAEQSYLLRAAKATSWPPARLFKRAADPLVRLGLVSSVKGRRPELREADGPSMVMGSSAVARSAVSDYVSASLGALPDSWRSAVAVDVDATTAELVDSADTLIAGVDLEYRRRPLWWRLVNVLHIAFFACVLAGFAWLAALAAGQWLHVKIPEPPYFGPVSIPAALGLGGLAAGWVLGAAARRWRALSARRVRSRVERRLAEEVRAGVEGAVELPVERERARYADFMESVGRLATVR